MANRVHKRSLARNSVLGLLSWLLPAVPSLVVTPIVVHRLGNERYGLYTAILGITSYFFTLGVGRIAAKYVAEYVASGEEERASQLMSAALVVTLTTTVVSVVVLIAATPYLVDKVLFVDPALQAIAIRGVWIAGALILFTAVAQVWQSALQGLQRFDVFLWLSNGMSLLLSIGLVVVVLVGGDVLWLLGWAAINGSLTLILSIVAVKWVWPHARVTYGIRRSDLRPVTVYAASIIGYQLFAVVVLLFERGWVIREFGLENVAFYLVPLNLSLLLLGITGSALTALFPVFNSRLADSDNIAVLYRRASKFAVVFVVLAVVGAIASGRGFLLLWLGPDYAERSWSLLVIHTITFSVVALSLIWWQLAEAYRKAPVTAYTSFAVMLITVPLMILLGRAYGLNGVALGRLFGLLPYVALWIYVERSFTGGFSVRFWFVLAARLAIPAGLSFLTLWIGANYLGTNWLTWMIVVGIGSIVYFGSLLAIGGFDTEDIAMFKDLIFRRVADA